MPSSLTPTKRGIQLALGVLWLLDGALQLQPAMFTRQFANQVIAPAADGQPGIVAGPMHLAIHILLLQPAAFNAVFGLIQLALGVLIIYRPTLRIGLLGSVAWGLIVWCFGEGLGGLLSGQTSLLMGAPGAVLLYVILALAVLPSRIGSRAEGGRRPADWLPLAWAGLWALGAVYQLLPVQNSAAGFGSMVVGMGQGAPSWMARLDNQVGNLIQGHGWGMIVALAVAQALVGLLALMPGWTRRLAVAVGIVLSLGFWATGQNLGAYYTGLATDPNSGPLFILMGVAILGCTPLDFRQLWQQTAQRVEQVIT